MRLLFTFAGGHGHFLPLLPLARAAQKAGHTVAFACQPAMAPAVEAAGFVAFSTGGATLRTSTQRTPLLPLNPAREDRAIRDTFAGRVARERAGAITALGETWHPALLVCDELDFGAMVAAEHLDIPHATVLVNASGGLVRRELVAESLHALRAEYRLAPDPNLVTLDRYLVFAPFPPSFRDPAFPLPATAWPLRPAETDASLPEDVAEWLPRARSAPLVYVTLGTVFHLESGDLFERVLAGLRELPVNVLATVGKELDPRVFGPQPANVRIERFVPQSLVLPHCQLVVSHAGSGSLMGALAHGLPSVLLPMGADQPLNAARTEHLSVARVLDPTDAIPDAIREAVVAMLAAPSYRLAARRMQLEIEALPGTDQAAALLERLADEKAPLFAT